MLDKLRVCIICSYYSNGGRLNLADYMNHPSICKLKAESIDDTIDNYHRRKHRLLSQEIGKCYANEANQEPIKTATSTVTTCAGSTTADEHKMCAQDFGRSNPANSIAIAQHQQNNQQQYNQQFDVNICVGNVSKYLNYEDDKSKLQTANNKSSTVKSQSQQMQLITNNDGDETTKANIESSQYNSDLITHKWMVYIRSSNCNKIENYIKKVIFYLHFSYKPHDVVEVKFVF